MKSSIQNKSKLVNSVFSKVHEKYDLMNDLMSLGIHRVWKKKFLDWMHPQNNNSLIDVASGTGDIAKLYSNRINNSGEISCIEPNKEMLSVGKLNLKNLKKLNGIKRKRKIPVDSERFDFYTISFGIRNVSNINLTLKEAFRVLKPGGRFMCLEFSKVDNEIIDFFYQNIPNLYLFLGKYVVGSSKPYDYLIKSIDSFYSQNELLDLMKKNGFSKVEYRNLSNGISAIHSGGKFK